MCVPRNVPAPEVRIGYTADPDVAPPSYQSDGAAGADVRARLAEPVTLAPGERRLIATGIRLEIPPGYEMQLRPRSGLALRHGITVLNTPGTIDSDYRGEVQVLLLNAGTEPFTVQNGDRIGQLVIQQVFRGVFEKKDALSVTERGSGGYGSTGV